MNFYYAIFKFFYVKTITNYKISAPREKCHVKDLFSILFLFSDLILLTKNKQSVSFRTR